MPRIRSVKPEFWSDEKLAPLDPLTRLVFLGLISMADDAGRLLDIVKQIDAFIFPETDHSSREALEELRRLGRILRYQLPNGQRVIQITHWERHQRVEKPGKNVLPPPPADVSSEAPEDSGRASGDSPEDSGRASGESPRAEGGGGGGRGTEDQGTEIPSPPPPSRARTREAEGGHPDPDAAGPRQQAAAGSEQREVEPDRSALIREMHAAVEARAGKLRGERRQQRFVGRAKAIIGGDDYTVWRDGHGRAASWPERPRLLRLALARTEGEDDPDLRAALRYVVLQQLDPVEAPTAQELRGNRPPPGSEAAGVREELPQRNGHRTGELVHVAGWPAEDPAEREQERLDALVREWERENPQEAEALRERIVEEVASEPEWQGIARAALPGLVRSRYRLAVRDRVEAQEVGR